MPNRLDLPLNPFPLVIPMTPIISFLAKTCFFSKYSRYSWLCRRWIHRSIGFPCEPSFGGNEDSCLSWASHGQLCGFWPSVLDPPHLTLVFQALLADAGDKRTRTRNQRLQINPISKRNVTAMNKPVVLPPLVYSLSSHIVDLSR